MSGGEIIVIFLVILLLFGSEKLPDLARTLGKGMNEFHKAKEEIQRELVDTSREIQKEAREIQENFEQEVAQVKHDLHPSESSSRKHMPRTEDGLIRTAFGTIKADEPYGRNDESDSSAPAEPSAGPNPLQK